jgi:diaminopimelate epimerase
MLLEPSSNGDFALRYFNCDGLESSMCGNGGRCIAAFAHREGLAGKNMIFDAFDGMHEASILAAEGSVCLVKLQMNDAGPVRDLEDGFFLDTGSPHFVKFVRSADEVDLPGEGREIRYDPRFAPGGCNVNFVEAMDGWIMVRTYERGVENETLSCGTGVTASALVQARSIKLTSGFMEVSTRGGNFRVHFSTEGDLFREVFLEGPAEFVFTGSVEI